jgi:biotin carboxylase
MGREFQRIAVVSRGEPALRLIRAVRELRAGGASLTTIALVTEPDRTLFARAADRSRPGPRLRQGRWG